MKKSKKSEKISLCTPCGIVAMKMAKPQRKSIKKVKSLRIKKKP